MKNPIIPLLAALGLCSISCYRTPAESGLKTVVAELPVRSRQMGITTRATDDEALRDVNWWLCDADDAVILHGFQNDATVRFECIPNTYRLRIAANMGTDLGNAPAWDDLRVSHTDGRDVLPMSCDVPLDIPAPAGDLLQYLGKGPRHRAPIRPSVLRAVLRAALRSGRRTFRQPRRLYGHSRTTAFGPAGRRGILPAAQ